MNDNRSIAPSFKKDVFFLSAYALLCGSCLFADGLPLNDSDIESKWFAAIFLSAIFCVVTLCKAFKSKRIIIFRQSDIIVSALFFYIVIRSLSGESSLFVLRLSAVVLFYVSFRFANDSCLKSFGLIVALLCTMLALWGIGQWLRLLPGGNRGFPVVGNFDNPAGYASALTAGFPFSFRFIRERKGLARVFAFLPTMLIVFAIILSGSRAGLLSVAVILLIVLTSKMKVSRPKKRNVAYSFVLLALIAALYFAKKESADGRFLIWFVSMRIIVRHPLFGGGSGAFLREYMPEQALFFQAHPDSRLAFLADNVSHPFNEYLSLFIQWGVVGFMLIGLLFFLLFNSWKRHRCRETDALMLALFSLLIFSLFSYPFSYPFSWVVFALCVAVWGSNTSNIIKYQTSVLLKSLLAVVPTLLFMLSAWQYQSYKEWFHLTRHRPSVPMSDLQQRYEKLRPAMERQSQFMYNYAAELYFHGCYSEALDVAYQSQSLRDDYETEHLLADIYKSMKKHSDAQAAYRTMSLMCPNRFIPLYRLFELAVEEDDKHNALQLAKEIVAKPIKVSSPQVVFIKKKCNLYISINQ